MKSSRQGFTLLELVMVLIIVGILGTVSVGIFGTNVDAERYEETRAKMEAIRGAILGDESETNQGRRQKFGYIGDWGSLPQNLSDLVNSKAPAWSYNATEGFGAGWKGPYLPAAFAGSYAISKDAWGKDFSYSPAANPPTLISYGADSAAGGKAYATDLVMTFPAHLRLATVRGFVADGSAPISGKTIEIRYPVTGTITAFTVLSDANGLFTFNNVPFGVRSIRVNGFPSLGPKPINIDSGDFQVPNTLLNFFGSQRVIYNIGSFFTSGTSNTEVNMTFNNTYNVDRRINYITLYFDRPNISPKGYFKQILVNGVSQNVANLTSGVRVQIPANLTFLAGVINTPMKLTFALNSNGTGNIDMTTGAFSALLEWVGSVDTDSVSFP